MSKFLDYNINTGITETFAKDGDRVYVGKTQDVNPFLKANTAEINNESGNFQGGWHKVASIPPIVIEMWTEELKAKGVNNPYPLAPENKNWLIAKLNSGDWSKLRTKSGRI
jgi:hypothetical protein